MKTLTIACSGLLIASLLASAAPAPIPKKGKPVNLVVNGSFEEGPDVEVFKPLDKGSKAIKGWVVTRGQIDFVQQRKGQGGQAAQGERFLDLHGSPGFGGVEQPIATQAGQKYRVTFQMSGTPGVGHTTVQIAVRAAGQNKVFECAMAGKTCEDLKWEENHWVFTAGKKGTVLEFHTAMAATANPFGGPLLDDVKVVAID